MSIYCKHWTDCGAMGGGCCSINLHGGKPSEGVCGHCNKREPGAGDMVAMALSATGAGPVIERIVKAVTRKSCGGCRKRRELLNRISLGR